LVCPPSPRAAPRSPPPFPTRRSSDLAGPPEQHLVTRPCLRGPWTTEPLVTVHEDVQGELPRLGVVVPHGVGTHTRPLVTRQGRRSEEHTSELQSRENLVCRLLLEKKN